MKNEEDIIYTDRPLDAQINIDKIQHIFGSANRQIAYITYRYEQAINKGKAYITLAYERVPNARDKMRLVIHTSDECANTKLDRIIHTRAFAHRKRRSR